jgi:hypothetical protein
VEHYSGDGGDLEMVWPVVVRHCLEMGDGFVRVVQRIFRFILLTVRPCIVVVVFRIGSP